MQCEHQSCFCATWGPAWTALVSAITSKVHSELWCHWLSDGCLRTGCYLCTITEASWSLALCQETYFSPSSRYWCCSCRDRTGVDICCCWFYYTSSIYSCAGMQSINQSCTFWWVLIFFLIQHYIFVWYLFFSVHPLFIHLCNMNTNNVFGQPWRWLSYPWRICSPGSTEPLMEMVEENKHLLSRQNKYLGVEKARRQ